MDDLMDVNKALLRQVKSFADAAGAPNFLDDTFLREIWLPTVDAMTSGRIENRFIWNFLSELLHNVEACDATRLPILEAAGKVFSNKFQSSTYAQTAFIIASARAMYGADGELCRTPAARLAAAKDAADAGYIQGLIKFLAVYDPAQEPTDNRYHPSFQLSFLLVSLLNSGVPDDVYQTHAPGLQELAKRYPGIFKSIKPMTRLPGVPSPGFPLLSGLCSLGPEVQALAQAANLHEISSPFGSDQYGGSFRLAPSPALVQLALTGSTAAVRELLTKEADRIVKEDVMFVYNTLKEFDMMMVRTEDPGVYGFTNYQRAPTAPAVEKSCAFCGKKKTESVKLFYCKDCESVLYCSAACSKSDWKRHKAQCKRKQKAAGAAAAQAGPSGKRER